MRIAALLTITCMSPLFLLAQNIGIGTNTPAARLHVADSSVLFSGPLNLPLNPGNPPVSGAGARMMRYSRKAAFRAGFAEGNEWDRDNIGPYSFGIGVGTRASGLFSTAMGSYTRASGDASIALGSNTTAKAFAAISMGYLNDDADNPSLLLGPNDRIFQLGNGIDINNKRNAITVLRNGNVGIGTVNPGALLHVNGNVLIADGTQAANRVLTSDANGLASWKDLPASNSVWTASGIDIYNINSGNVGIGTTSPGERLEVSGRVFLRSLPGLSAGLWFDNTFSNFKSAFIGMQADNRIGIFGGDGAGWAFTVNTQNGRVGVGTTAAQNPLDVVAGPSATATKLVIANRGGFGPAALEFVSDYGLSSQWRPGYIASGDNGSFTGKLEFFTNGTGSGNLYGAVKGLEVRNGATLTATGSVGSFSDARLKNNIEPFTDGLNVIEQINPVQFHYNADAPFVTPEKQVGIVAQELEKVAPYMVHQTAEGSVKDMRWVDNQAYVFLLINAVKELKFQVEEQQKEIEALKKGRRNR